MNKLPEFIIHKIPLEGFIDILAELYNKGAMFIDIIVAPEAEQDVLSILVRHEYVDPEHNEFGGEEITESLTDIDLNKLI